MNFEAFLRDVLTPLLDHPEAFRVEVSGEGRKRDVLVFADPRDRGRIIGKHVDVMSFNYYTAAALDTNLLQRIHRWTGGRPLMLSEFFWSSPSDSGLTGGREMKSQRERGLAYRNYVERAAALGIVVGIEWFTLVDQSATGRWFSGFNGEAGNSGLIAVTDRPWTDAVAEMRKTNLGIYPVWFGEAPPFVFDDPRFNPPAAK